MKASTGANTIWPVNPAGRRDRTTALLAFLCTGLLAAIAGDAAPEARQPLGFAHDSAERLRSAEQQLKGALSAGRIGEFHRWLSARPHPAGSAASNELARRIAETLRGFGLSVETHEYQVYLSAPKRLSARVMLNGRPQALRLSEPPHPREPDAGHPELTPGFVAYSAFGRVRGPVVYANYGLPGDYDALKAAGVDIRGAIALVRYGKVHRAVKVFTAEQRGARAILIYSDPADDGFAKGKEWPDGPWRAPWMAQRGNAKYSWHWHGDPLTPFVPARPNQKRLAAEDAPTLPRIPALVLSRAEAEPILRELRGPAAPRSFQGALPMTYRLGATAGGDSLEAELDVEMEAGLRPITNVVARLDGREEPDRWVLLGTHHDAWTFGGVDPGGAAAVMLELARALGELRRSGWQPRRSILFCFWDAEEYGLIGSTEFAEEFSAELRARAVAYINTDMYLAGGLRAGGTAALRDFAAEVARETDDPSGSGKLYDGWRAKFWNIVAQERQQAGRRLEVELDPLGSGADFVPFQTHLGLPVLSLEFGELTNYGTYHSAYDTRAYMETFGDPGWKYGVGLAELLGRTAMRLASADVLPLRFSHTAEKLRSYLRALETANHDPAGKPLIADLRLETARAQANALGLEARTLEQRLAGRLTAGQLAAERARRANDHLVRAELSFIAEDGAAGASARWYRHTVYGWNIYSLYAGQALPALHRALQQRDRDAFRTERARLETAIRRATEELKKANAALK